ncbi:MAG TPA: hypothetical protein VGJ78_08660 [Vicinamibacterales bacterium]
MGVSVAVTLQKGNGADTVMVAVPLLAVVVKGAVMSVADVTVPSSSRTLVRLLHAVAAIGRRAANDIAAKKAEQKRTGTPTILSRCMISSTERRSGEFSRQRAAAAYRREIGTATTPAT